MSVIAPPPVAPPSRDELEALIREARARQRRRWIAAIVAVVAGAAVGVASMMNGTGSHERTGSQRSGVVATTNACGITVAGIRILQGGQTVYREPGHLAHPNGGSPAQVQCSGASIWVVWLHGGEMSQEAYFGVHSSDAGRTWRAVFTERYFGLSAPHQLDSYFGPWTLRGPHDAYFVGTCPACGFGTVSLWVTKDGGGTLREYKVPALTGFEPTGLRVLRGTVTINAIGAERGTAGRKTAKVRVG